MTDHYEKIRKALAKGPTQGPWGATHGDAYLIAACDFDTIRALLEERDQLAAALEAAREDTRKLRETLRTTSAVGIVQLFSTARDDVLAEFSLEELHEICRVTEHLRPVYAERIYRAAWDAAMQEADQ